MNCEEVREAAGAYALRALPPEEMREVEAHLRECNLHEEFASLRATVSLLAFTAEERDPPAVLQSRIMAAVLAGDGASRAAPAPVPFPMPRREPRGIRPSWALAAALALLAIGLLAWNITLLRADDGAPRQVFVPQPVTVTGVPTSALVGRVIDGPAAGTVLRYIAHEQVSVLEVIGLGQLEAGRIYQIWTLSGKDVTGVGLFTVAPDGTARVAFTSPLFDGDTVAVTEEPAGGSAAPTSEPLFAIPVGL
jgi:anti-sigma-K factor RskA